MDQADLIKKDMPRQNRSTGFDIWNKIRGFTVTIKEGNLPIFAGYISQIFAKIINMNTLVRLTLNTNKKCGCYSYNDHIFSCYKYLKTTLIYPG